MEFGISFGIKENLQDEFSNKELILIKTGEEPIMCNLCILTKYNKTEENKELKGLMELIKAG